MHKSQPWVVLIKGFNKVVSYLANTFVCVVFVISALKYSRFVCCVFMIVICYKEKKIKL